MSVSVCNLVNTWFPRCGPEGVSYFFRTPAMRGGRQPRMSDNWSIFEYIALFSIFIVLMVIICEQLTSKYSLKCFIWGCLTFFIPNFTCCPCQNTDYNGMPPFCLTEFENCEQDNIEADDSDNDDYDFDDDYCDDDDTIQYCCNHATKKLGRPTACCKKRTKCTNRTCNQEPDLIKSTNKRRGKKSATSTSATSPRFHIYTMPTCLQCTANHSSCTQMKSVRNKSRASRR